MKWNILRSTIAFSLLCSTAIAANFTYSSYGGIMDGSATGTADFSINHTYVDPNYSLGGDTVYAGIDWGIGTENGQSGLRTIPKSGTIESDGTLESFGDLVHINYPITSAGGSLLYTTVKWHLDLHDANTSNDFNRTWTFDLYNWETSNGADPCPRETDGVVINPADGHPYLGDGLSESNCDDAHDFGATMDQNYTWVNGPTLYKISISGFYDDQDELKQTFWAPENGSSTGYVKFAVTEVGPSAVTIGNRVWLDTNNDGIQDPSETAGAPGVIVELWEVNPAGPDILRQTTTTGGNGEYYFHNVPTDIGPGPISYYLKFICPEDAELYEFTRKDVGGDDAVDSDVDPLTGETDPFTLTVDTNDFDAGVRCGSIGDFVWNDENQNGIQDIGEMGIEGATINLYKEGNSTVFKTTSSGINGEYVFGPIGSGNYVVEFIPLTAYSLSPQDQGSDDDIDSDANETTGRTATITIDLSDEGVAQHVTNNDAGMYYCLCNDIKSDSSSAMNNITTMLMIALTIILGIFFIRREEKSIRNER
jgi:hypothetical protein